MNRYLTTALNSSIKDVHDLHHVLKSGRSHVFPALIEPSDAMGIEVFRNIAKANIWNDAIPTKRVLNNDSNSTSPGYCKFRTVPILDCLKTLYKLNYLMSRSEGLCIAKISSLIQFE